MRIFSCLLLSLAIAACGSKPGSVDTGMSSTAVNQPDPAALTPGDTGTLQADSNLIADDIGAIVLGESVSVPAFQELQIAAVVTRAGAFSPADSFVETMVSSGEQKKSIRLVAFAANGPLRPGTSDTLVMILGRSAHFSGPSSPMYGNDSPGALHRGQPYAELCDLTYGDQIAGHIHYNDVHHPENTLFSVHIYGRLVALAANDPRQLALAHSGRGSVYNGELPIPRLEDIVPRERPLSSPPTSTF